MSSGERVVWILRRGKKGAPGTTYCAPNSAHIMHKDTYRWSDDQREAVRASTYRDAALKMAHIDAGYVDARIVKLTIRKKRRPTIDELVVRTDLGRVLIGGVPIIEVIDTNRYSAALIANRLRTALAPFFKEKKPT